MDVNGIEPGSNSIMTDKHTSEHSKTACSDIYWSVCDDCIYCSYNNIARGVNILDRNAIFDFTCNFSSPEPKAHGEFIVYQSSRRPSVRPSVRPCVRASTLLNINISETSGPIATKFYLKHHWGGGKAARDFWPDRIGTLVSMATDSSHWVIMGENLVSTLAPSFLIGSSSYLQVTRTTIISRTSSNFSQIRQRTADIAALERLKKFP